MGGKTRTGSDGEVAKGWDHDPPAKEKLTPFGILMVAGRILTGLHLLNRRSGSRG